MWNGDRVLVRCLDEVDYVDPEDEEDLIRTRFFGIFLMTDEQVKESNRRQELFRKHVGTHQDYPRCGGTNSRVHPQSEWNKYYDEAKNWPDLEEEIMRKPPVAWYKS